MRGTFVVTVVAVLALGGAGRGQEKDEARRAIDLGHLGEFFELVKAEPGPAPGRPAGPAGLREGSLVLTLRAKAAVDTSDLSFKVGCFDRDGTLLRAVPLRLDGFPLEKGESIRAACDGLVFADPGGRIVIRKAKRPVPKQDGPAPAKAGRAR